MTESSTDTEYLVFTADENHYGVGYTDVVSVVDLKTVSAVPGFPPGVRGILSFREHGIPVLDLRVCFGATSRVVETDELVTTMALRKQDHINWLNKLKEEVHGGKPISVQTNPHLCTFGKWYDQFRSSNKNLNDYMERFDIPHQWIHQVAVDAGELLSAGRGEEAKRLVHQAEHGVLELLVELFDGMAEVVRRYLSEYAVVFDIDGQTLALAADDIQFFGRLDYLQHATASGSGADGAAVVQAIGRYRKENDGKDHDVLLLDVRRLVAHVAGEGGSLSGGLGSWVGSSAQRGA